MIRVSVIYKHDQDTHFDSDYALNTHMPLVEKLYAEFGLVGWDFEVGASLSSKHPSNIAAIASIYFNSIEDVKNAFKNKGAEVMADTKNYTNIEPTVLTSELKGSLRTDA